MLKCFVRSFASVCRAFFFGNIFLSVLVIVLSIETAFQLRIPLGNGYYYLSTAIGVYLYYSYAYTRSVASYDRRGRWYIHFQRSIRTSQQLAAVCLCLLLPKWIIDWVSNWQQLSWPVQLFYLSFPIISYGYYGAHLPSFLVGLRKKGWLKCFIIGYVWAGIVNCYPLLFTQQGAGTFFTGKVITYFLYNWSFFSVNAILFDIKDQKVDTYFGLPTFIVQLGVSKTIARVIWPLLAVSGSSLCFFAYLANFSLIQLWCNLVPFLFLASCIWTLKQRQKSLLYYLIVVDGLLFLKALTGIVGALLAQRAW